MNKKYSIVFLSVVAVCVSILLYANYSKQPGQQTAHPKASNSVENETISFTTQSVKKELPTQIIATCPTDITQDSYADFSTQGYIPVGVELTETTWHKKTNSVHCHYKDPITNQTIPGILHKKIETECTVPTIIENTVRC